MVNLHDVVNLFDERPATIGGFVLSATGATPANGTPTPEGWQLAFDYAMASEESSPYWVGDLLAYAESRADWKAIFDQLIGKTKLAPGTLHNRSSISRSVSREARALAPSISHAAVVAGLSPEDQVTVLGQVKAEGLNVHQTRKVVKRLTRPKIIEGQATLTGRYRVIYVAPDWDAMTIDTMRALPVTAHAMRDAALFLWVPASRFYDNPGPRDVIEGWEFKPKTQYIWNTVIGRLGHYSYVQHELLVLATRGSCLPDAQIAQHDHASIFAEKRQGEQSQKPTFARKLIEGLYPEGSKLELFGRKPVQGWQVFGSDHRIWGRY